MIRTKHRLLLLIFISTVFVGGLVMLFVQGNDFGIKAFDVNDYQREHRGRFCVQMN